MMVLAGCTGDDADREAVGPTSPTGVTVEVTETEYSLDVEPRDGLIPARYTFIVRSSGQESHALAVRGPGVHERTPPIPGGEEPVEILVRLLPGRYELWCPVDDHRERGMQTSFLIEAL